MTNRAAQIANALQYVNDPTKRASLEAELCELGRRAADEARPWTPERALAFAQRCARFA